MSIRTPVVSGTFYPDGPMALRHALDEAMGPPAERKKAFAVVVPHAGYMYSGRVAGAVYARVEIPQDVVILCFNHRGAGKRFAVWREGAWQTPIGDVPVNADLAAKIKEAFLPAEYDEIGHLEEHSGEVQVPFLQRARPGVRIAPVALSVGLDTRSFEQLREFGKALAGVSREFLVVASTDLNHYEDQKTTLEKDRSVIEAVERLDEALLREAILVRDISMCGYAPTIAAIAYAKAKGARAAATVTHATSGDASGEYGKVVGYAGMIIPCGN